MGGAKEERTFVSPFHGLFHRSVNSTIEDYRIIGGKLRMKKLLGAILCIGLLLSLLSVTAFAATEISYVFADIDAPEIGERGRKKTGLCLAFFSQLW